jgi:5-hydroxyisourate hydrolase
MGLSTHALDTMHGVPASGMKVTLARLWPDRIETLSDWVLNTDGRTNSPLLSTDHLEVGRYRLSFSAGDYFRARCTNLAEPLFLDVVHLDFGVSSAKQHYHVPLLVSPWSYSTYRGS